MFIKLGLRKNLLYPTLFILSLLLRIIGKAIYNFFLSHIKSTYTIFGIIYFMQLIRGLTIILYRRIKTHKQEKEVKFQGIVLIQNEGLKGRDSEIKIFILIFFSAFFEIIGALTRRYFNQKLTEDRYEEYHAKFRSIEIIFSSILCYFTFHIKMHKHQLLSLFIICLSLIIVLIIDIVSEDDFIGNLSNIMISSLCRAYLDTTEKYLFDYDYIDVFEIMGYEAIVNCILTPILYISDKPRKEITNILGNDSPTIALTFFLLFVYSLFTLFKNIYRRLTITVYYPMTRALAESILDPILIIYDFCFNKKSYQSNFSFTVTLSCNIINIICSCIYNEVFILYCYELEYDTHYEIANRAKIIELIGPIEADDLDETNDKE